MKSPVLALVAGLLVPVLVPLLMMAPLAEGDVSVCHDPAIIMKQERCSRNKDFCYTLTCKRFNDLKIFSGCGGKGSRTNRDDICRDLSDMCSSGFTLMTGKEGCQLCSTDKCNTGDLKDGGDYSGVGGPFPVNWMLLLGASLLICLGHGIHYAH